MSSASHVGEAGDGWDRLGQCQCCRVCMLQAINNNTIRIIKLNINENHE